MGHYGMCLLGGRPVAGIGPQMGGGDAPPAWLTYLAVDDVEKTAEAIASNGGTVVAPPMDVGDAGPDGRRAGPGGRLLRHLAGRRDDRLRAVQRAEFGRVERGDEPRPRAHKPSTRAVFGYEFEPVEGLAVLDAQGRLDHGTVGGIGATGRRASRPTCRPTG